MKKSSKGLALSMECNKDEALRAKELAEKKMSDNDYGGAIKMIQKAQTLYPNVGGAEETIYNQMLAVCQVHSSAERKVGVLISDHDWYSILQVPQTAGELSIKKQYKKLALLLHPDKNNFSGAEAAFKLIGDAHTLLCDQTKRAQFDRKLKNSMISQQQRQYPCRSNCPCTGGTGVQFTSMNKPYQQQTTQPASTDAQQTFCSACPFCSVRHQCNREYLEKAVRCQSCRNAFIAFECIPSGGINDQPLPRKNKKRRRKSDPEMESFETVEKDKNKITREPVVLEVADPDFYDFDKDKVEGSFASNQIWAVFDDLDGMPRLYARIKKVYSPFKVVLTWLDFVAGDPDETSWERSGLPVACGKFKHQKNDTTTEDIRIFSHMIVSVKGVRSTYKIYPQKGETWALLKNWNINWSSDPDNHGKYEYAFVVVLSNYSNESGMLVAHLVKLKGFKCLFKPSKTNGMSCFLIQSNEMLRFSHRVPSFRTNGKERKDVPEGYFELDPASLPANLEEVSDFVDRCKNVNEENVEESVHNVSTSDGVTSKAAEVSESVDGCCKNVAVPKISTSDGVTAKAAKVPEQISSSPSSTLYPFELPESEFYCFNVNKKEDSFQAGQVWATYCALDGMPKYYALIKKVVSIPEFKVNLQWLEACTPPNGLFQWLDIEIPTCVGVFSGGEETEYEIASFSHVLKGTAALEEDKYEIYPREGEVWAIYKNFSSEWSPSDLQTCEYDIGKVIEADDTMKVMVLEKVSGYETVFKVQTKAGRESVLEIPRCELLRFSHQIPVFQLTDELEGTLRGCFELDPKAIPECVRVLQRSGNLSFVGVALHFSSNGFLTSFAG